MRLVYIWKQQERREAAAEPRSGAGEPPKPFHTGKPVRDASGVRDASQSSN